ncbi:MAG: addiction module protein [Verrucomicrobiota bacterium]
MTEVAQLRDVVSLLSAPDRAELAAFLLSSLEETHYWVDDEEVLRRCDELESGSVRGLTMDEFRQACGR